MTSCLVPWSPSKRDLLLKERSCSWKSKITRSASDNIWIIQTCRDIAHLTKRNNFREFLFGSLEYEAISKGIYSQRKEVGPGGATSFLQELTPLRMVAEMKIAELHTLVVLPFTFISVAGNLHEDENTELNLALLIIVV